MREKVSTSSYFRMACHTESFSLSCRLRAAPLAHFEQSTGLFDPAGGGNESAPVSESGDGFVDVSDDAYYAPAVAWALAEGVTAGTDAQHFSPNAKCTRAQTVTSL